MQFLLDTNADFDSEFFRNIVSRRVSEDLFDDISGGDETLNTLAIQSEMRVKQHLSTDKISRGLHYSTAVDHVFDAETYMSSRYGDGMFPVLYGSLELDTTVHETVYHFARFVLDSEGVDEIVRRDQAVYAIHCRALLVDLRGKRETHPQLVGDDYKFTQEVGRRVSSEGLAGLLAPSARVDGTNVVVFKRDVLSEVGLHCYFTYTLDPSKMTVAVERQPDKLYMTVNVRVPG